ncbi:MAG TPA: hypothetical protein VM680_07335, partial [Verrucomicrobiae bacterium]|nr:hypothetical protein [Verrucomicrobiae bacterium]
MKALPVVCIFILTATLRAVEMPIVPVRDPQPLSANVGRVIEALNLLGAPLDSKVVADLTAARDGDQIQ